MYEYFEIVSKDPEKARGRQNDRTRVTKNRYTAGKWLGEQLSEPKMIEPQAP